MKSKFNVTAFSLVTVSCLPLCAYAQSTVPQPALQQQVTELQSSPNDTVLREKIIALVQTMNPPPAIPEEAREHYVMAATFMESAKDNTGFEHAIDQYKAALLVAPWWADAYKKLAIAQKAAAHYDDAIASLHLYLASQPADARDAQDEIYKLKALKQVASDNQAKQQGQQQLIQESSPQAKLDALLEKVDGRKYIYQPPDPSAPLSYVDVEGHTLTFWAQDQNGNIVPFAGTDCDRMGIDGFETICIDNAVRNPNYPYKVTVILSEDGESITYRGETREGHVVESIFR